MTLRPTTAVSLIWDTDPGATAGYDLYRNGAKVATAAATATTTRATLNSGDLFEVVGKPSGVRQQVQVSWVSHTVDPAPPPPPPPPTGLWAWNARTASLDPTSPQKIAAFMSYAVGKGTYFEADVAWADAPAGTPMYSIPTNQSNGTPLIAPKLTGLKPGAQNDHTLCIKGSDGTYYDIQLPQFDSNGVITHCDGGAYCPPGSPYETGPKLNSGNAARFSLRPGAVTPADIKSGVIGHALQFTMPNCGKGPTVYPGSGTVGYPANTGFNLGTWVALDPSLDVHSLGLTGWELTVAVALQTYGMFCRDIGSTLCVVATDQVNQGGNAKDWGDAGVNLTGKTPAGVPYIAGFSSRFPWSHLRVLLPPAH